MSEKITYDDVNAAFSSNNVLVDSDERLMEYLRVLCSAQIRSDENRLLANNRCITINTILTRRFMEQVDRATTKYTTVVVILALASLIASVVQIWVSTK
jgi:hypothetical protein